MNTEWKTYKLRDVVQFNPTERIAKGTLAKKVSMDKLIPYCREVSGYNLESFTGGMKFRNGDTIMARITPCLENGKTSYVSFLEENEIGFGSTEYIVFRAIKDVTDSKFIYYFVTNPTFRSIAIKSMVGSSGRQRVQQSVLEELEISLPPLEEQRRIAGILSAIDDKIENNRRINTNLELQAQALYKQWFVDFDFPNEEGKPYKSSGGKMIDSELGPIPDGWSVGLLKDVVSFQSGFAFKSDLFTDSGKYRLITIKGVQDGYLDINGAVYINDIPNKMPSYCLLEEGDIIMSLTGNVGRCCVVDRENLLLNQRVVKLQPTLINSNMFIYTMFRRESFKEKLIALAKGTAQANLSPIETANLHTILPDNSIMKKYCEYGEPIFASLLNNIKESINLATLRDTLLPKLMNGEIKTE